MSSSEIRRIQAEHGDDAFAMLSGVSLTNEKSYLVGKFARLALHTANLDYNGRFCMVSAGTGNKKALGVDRAPNPWSDIPLADVVWVAGSNVAETFPITTSYIWRARDRGAKLIVQDPRVVPLARTADLFLPGATGHRLGAVRCRAARARSNATGSTTTSSTHHTVNFDDAAAAVADMTPAWAAGITGVPAARIEEAAELWGTSATGMMLHARGIEQHTKGVDNVLAAINLGLATGKFGKPGCGVSTITGQGNGQGGREHGHKCDQLPGNRDITNPEHRAAVAKVWNCDEADIPGKGLPAEELIEAIHDGTIKGLLSICFNPARVGARLELHPRGARQARVLRGHRLLPVRVRSSRRHRPARLAARGGRGHLDERRGSDHQDQRRRHATRRGPPRLGDPARHRRASRQERVLPVHEHRADLRRALPGEHRWHRRLHRRHLATDRGRDGPVLADPRSRPPRHATAARGRPVPLPRRSGPASTACRTSCPPRSSTTSTRCC